MEKKKNIFLKFIDRQYLAYFVISFVSYFIMEIVNRRSVFGAFEFLIVSPHIFALNFAIVLLSYSFVLFFSRKLFIYSVVSIFWIIVDGINFALLMQRNTQFNASDIVIFKYGIFITARYFNAFQIVLLVAGIILVVVGIVFLYRLGYKSDTKLNNKISALICVIEACLAALLILIGTFSGFLCPRFTDIQKGYKENGFIYAFACTIFEKGINASEEYSEDSIEGISKTLCDDIDTSDFHPNVVFIQLESFIPPSELVNFNFESSPTPNFDALSEKYPSGYLNVPVVGGGTANTEFELLSGMRIKDFGTVEYPYETFLRDTACESQAYNYKALGYKAHAIHNFSAGFYRRNEVFANLGFDTFTSFEFMTDIENNPIGWAKDFVLEKYILAALESTTEKDFIYTISVQGHGSYPNSFDEAQNDTYALYNDAQSFGAALEYYISQVHEMDEFVGNLTTALSSYDEPTVVVFFGDHLPGMNFTEDMLKSNSIFKTKYLIWSNYDLEADDRDVYSYQLGSYVQSLIGFSSGKLTQLHQKYWDQPEYESYLKTLEYDIHEENNIVFGGQNPYKPTDLKYGVIDVKITDVNIVGNSLYITGENFNSFSSVYINGSHKSTKYLNENSLMVDGVVLTSGDSISVAQMSYQAPWEYLSMSDVYEYKVSQK